MTEETKKKVFEEVKKKILLDLRKALIEEIMNMKIENEYKDILDEIRDEFYKEFSRDFPKVLSNFINSSLDEYVERLSDIVISSILKPPDEEQMKYEEGRLVRKGYLLAWLSVVEDEISKNKIKS